MRSGMNDIKWEAKDNLKIKYNYIIQDWHFPEWD